MTHKNDDTLLPRERLFSI